MPRIKCSRRDASENVHLIIACYILTKQGMGLSALRMMQAAMISQALKTAWDSRGRSPNGDFYTAIYTVLQNITDQ